MNKSFEEIKAMKISMFMKIVKHDTKEVAFQYLLSKVKSKGKDYGSEIKSQKYLLPNRILTWDEQIEIFSYRSRMNPLKYNFGGQENFICSLPLDNEHILHCESLNEGKSSNMEYNHISMETSNSRKIQFKF